MSYSATVPGSLMLFGEHAVLHGGWSVVCATESNLTVTLTPRSDSELHIYSEQLGEYHGSVAAINIEPPFEFVLAAVATIAKQGCDLLITSEFAADLGFGSSAAVTVATLQVLQEWLLPKPLPKLELFKLAREVVRSVQQQLGSGADIAASLYGGCVQYRAEPLEIILLPSKPPLVAIYSGEKVPTREVIKLVAARAAEHQELFAAIYAAISACTEAAITPLKQQDWQVVGELMNIHQGLQEALGVNTPLLAELVLALQAQPGIYGAKISGAGLGDCVVGLGSVESALFPQNSVQQQFGVRQVKRV